jgi:3-oxoacyl-[acyl-carrier protein] reductase
MKKLEGKVAVVTGASKGIGASIARHLAAEGASVVVNYASSKKGADIVVEEITRAGGKAIAVGANVAKQAEIEQLFAQTVKVYGHVDILVNNAGVYEFAALEEINETSFHHMFDLNVLGLLLTTQEAVKHFTDKGGSIVNISSVAARGLPGASVYSATKGAVNTITGALAKELGPRKIRVNGVAPGMVITEGTDAAGITGAESDFRKRYEEQSALGRVGQPQDIGTVATFLASDDASWVTGETLYVSGGY